MLVGVQFVSVFYTSFSCKAYVITAKFKLNFLKNLRLNAVLRHS